MPPKVRTFVTRHPVALVAGLAVLLRLPALGTAPGADEAGFLMVGRQWASAGTSLYGNYWVDRPPVLITIFRIAAELGGVVTLRLIGCLAVALLVLGSARVAGRLGGHRAALCAGVVAAAWCVSYLTGSAEVNGELLAAPFVVWGIDAVLASLTTLSGGGRRDLLTLRAASQAAAAGGLAVGALLVKQNFADVGVFAVAYLAFAMVRREVALRDVARFAGFFTAGSLTALAVVSGWTLMHGTSLVGVYDAMYPFRIHAAQVMAASANPAPAARFDHLLVSWVLSGLGLITLVIAWALVSRRFRLSASYGLAALLLFDIASVVLGGNFWSHYLMQLVTPAAPLAGLLVARRQPGARALVAAVALAAVVSGVRGLPGPASTSATRLGSAVRTASRPGDTIVTVYGHSEVSETSGLSSPYPYLWSLPVKTLDPRLHALDAVLAGPDAPTWFVTYAHVTSWGVDSAATVTLLTERYHPVSVLEGHTVYLRDGVQRSPPR